MKKLVHVIVWKGYPGRLYVCGWYIYWYSGAEMVFTNAYYHKWNDPAVRYEVGVACISGEILWLNVPLPAGAYPDNKYFGKPRRRDYLRTSSLGIWPAQWIYRRTGNSERRRDGLFGYDTQVVFQWPYKSAAMAVTSTGSVWEMLPN